MSARAVVRCGWSGGPPSPQVAPGGGPYVHSPEGPLPPSAGVQVVTPAPSDGGSPYRRVCEGELPPQPFTPIFTPFPFMGGSPYDHTPEGPLPWFPAERWDAWRPSGGGRHGFTHWRMP